MYHNTVKPAYSDTDMPSKFYCYIQYIAANDIVTDQTSFLQLHLCACHQDEFQYYLHFQICFLVFLPRHAKVVAWLSWYIAVDAKR